MKELLETEFLQIPLATWFLSLGVGVLGVIVAFVVRAVGSAIVRRRPNAVRSDAPGSAPSSGTGAGSVAGGDQGRDTALSPGRLFALRVIQSFAFPAIILAGFYAGVSFLGLEGRAWNVNSAVFVVLFSLVFIRFLVAVVNELFRRAAEGTHRFDFSRVRPVRSIAIFAVWIAGLLFLLDNLGLDITAVVAGLGIGGIAIALAAQALLGDLFSYFVILFDKPFELGDFLIFGDILGTVERIGVKTTRLRSLSGEQITLSNSDLTASRIRNYKRMESRRVVFRIGVVYGTAPELLKEIPALLKTIVETQEPVTFDRAHFASYGDWSLSFEIVYYVGSPDYNLYMDIQERINYAIYDEFSARGIEFAFPTRTVHMAGPRPD